MNLSLFTGPARRTIPLEAGAEVTITDRWLTASRAGVLFDLLRAEQGWQQEMGRIGDRVHLEPRMSIGYGTSYSYSGVSRTAHPMPVALLELLSDVERETGVRFNAALVQLYRDGEDSIGFHADDEPELGRDPVIAAVSLGGSRRLSFRSCGSAGRAAVPVELSDGSLLVMSGATQRLYQHAIHKVKKAAPRISVTFRLVR